MKEAELDAFEFNKIAGACLGTLLLTMSLNVISGEMFSNSPLKKPAYNLAFGEAAEAAKSNAPAVAPVKQRLAKADMKKGEADAKPCQACHNFDKDAGVKIGPPLYGIVDRPKGSVGGYDYSDAIKSKGGEWTDADLDQFLASPKAYAQGTKMTFAGVADPTQRADIIAYLHELTANPAPLPSQAEPDKSNAPAVAPVEEQEMSAQKKVKRTSSLAKTGTSFEKIGGDKISRPHHGIVGQFKVSTSQARSGARAAMDRRRS
jgi:cytochrome c